MDEIEDLRGSLATARSAAAKHLNTIKVLAGERELFLESWQREQARVKETSRPLIQALRSAGG
jgi:hypothetical protein